MGTQVNPALQRPGIIATWLVSGLWGRQKPKPTYGKRLLRLQSPALRCQEMPKIRLLVQALIQHLMRLHYETAFNYMLTSPAFSRPKMGNLTLLLQFCTENSRLDSRGQSEKLRPISCPVPLPL